MGVVQTKMPRPKREKVVGAWINLHNEELYVLHYSLRYWGVKSRENEMDPSCNRYFRQQKYMQSFDWEA